MNARILNIIVCPKTAYGTTNIDIPNAFVDTIFYVYSTKPCPFFLCKKSRHLIYLISIMRAFDVVDCWLKVTGCNALCTEIF